jgi:type VI secretion system protein ImpL
VRKLYASAVRRLVIDPVFKQDVEEMDGFVRRYEATEAPPATAEHARFYDKLKMHLLLTAPRGAGEPALGEEEQAFVGAQIAERWTRRWTLASDPVAAEHLAANAALYVRLLGADAGQAQPGGATLALPRYEDLVRRIRRVLARVPPASLALEKLLVAADGKGQALSLDSILGGPLASLKARARVRAGFTRAGYDEVMKPRLDDAAGALEPWVLAVEGRDVEGQKVKELEELRGLYFSRYIEEWRRFVDSIEVAGASGSAQALALLQDLTRGEPPPYARLFRAIAHNTRIAGALSRAGEGVVDRLRKTLGATPAGQAASAATRDDRLGRAAGPADVERTFAGLVAFGVPPDAAAAAAGGAPAPQKNLPLDVWQEQVVFVRDALQTAAESSDPAPLVGKVQAARTRIRSLIDTQEIGWRPQLERLLWPPIEAASSSSAREAAAGATQKWCAQVVTPFRRTLAGRYPFQREGDDAAIADLSEFFKPAGGLLWGFYAETLRSEIQRAGDGFKFTRQLGGQSGFRGDLLAFLKRAQEITTVLFPASASEPSVPFSVRIRPTPGVAAVILEVDGQRFDYFNGPEEWRRMTWPGGQGKAPGAMLRVRAANGREETLQQEGEWGLFRLLDAGKLRGEPGVRDFAMSFSFASLGVSVVMDFRPARSESPFFGTGAGRGKRLLAPFRSGFAVPTSIGKGGPGCG